MILYEVAKAWKPINPSNKGMDKYTNIYIYIYVRTNTHTHHAHTMEYYGAIKDIDVMMWNNLQAITC